jgi:hypothetical protein
MFFKGGKMNLSILFNFAILLVLTFTLCSCSDEKGGSSAAFSDIEEVGGDESSSDDANSSLIIVEESSENNFTKVYGQNFESFDLPGKWMLSDFGLQGEKDKEHYVSGDQLGFDIRWTKRTRNLLADKLGYQRSEMTHEFTNTHCEPKIEIGKESTYSRSSSSNIIAELDSDALHCGIGGSKTAALTMRSFVPTKIGYKYKVKVNYMMRSYGTQTAKSYKDLVVSFGSQLEKFDPVYNSFKTVELVMTASRKYSKLTLRDNGLPDSYGVLIDDISVEQGEKVAQYDQCAELFSLSSRGFRKCVLGEVSTDMACDLSDISQAVIRSSNSAGVANNRRDELNIFNVAAPKSGTYNFYSLGLKGKLSISCAIDGHAALYSIEGKTLLLREISWGNATLSTYPELAKVRVKLSSCDDESLNRVVNLGSVATNEFFSYTFNQDSEGRHFSGCKMSKLIIKDITPSGPSTDGFDLNSLQFSN